MPSSTTLSVLYESLNPRLIVSPDTLTDSMMESEKEEPKYDRAHTLNGNHGGSKNNTAAGLLNTIFDVAENNQSNNNKANSNNNSNNSINQLNLTNNDSSRVLIDRNSNRVETVTSSSSTSPNFSISLLPFSIDMEMAKDLVLTLALTVWGMLVSLVMQLIPRSLRYKKIEGQVVLITGAGSGIGRLMAKKLALKHGATIVVWDINKQGADETVRDIKAAGGKCYGYTVDVSNKDKIFEAAEKVKTEVGKVDILINNAGVVSGCRFLETPDSQVERTFQVNALANFWTCKSFLPGMLKDNNGHIVTVASTAGLVGVNRLVDYCASKYAAVGFHEALVCELKGELGHKGIQATLVCPYYINTGMFDGVKSKLIPILEPDDVVDDVIAGILTNQEVVIMPRYILYLIVAKYFMPAKITLKCQEALGITGTMLGFKGRPGGNKPAVASK